MSDLPAPPRTADELAALLRPMLPGWSFRASKNRPGFLATPQGDLYGAYLEHDSRTGALIADLALQLAECRGLRAETGDGPELSEDDAARTLR